MVLVVEQPGRLTVTVWLAPSEASSLKIAVKEVVLAVIVWLIGATPGMLRMTTPS